MDTADKSSKKKELPIPRTLGTYWWDGMRRAHKNRPFSFYLLPIMAAELLLGMQMIDATTQPRAFIIYWSAHFLFFGAVMARAIVDFFEISRRFIKENNQVFRSTLGDQAFITELGQRVAETRERD